MNQVAHENKSQISMVRQGKGWGLQHPKGQRRPNRHEGSIITKQKEERIKCYKLKEKLSLKMSKMLRKLNVTN